MADEKSNYSELAPGTNGGSVAQSLKDSNTSSLDDSSKTLAPIFVDIQDVTPKSSFEKVDVVEQLEPEAPAADAETKEEAVVKLSKKELLTMSFAMALAVFLMALDENIIATAIPRITDEFHSLDDVGWYGSAYLLTMSCFQLHYGKLYQNFSAKWVFLGAVGCFELGSLICAVSPNSLTLIVGRAVAGSGACGIISGLLIIVAKAVPLRQRAMYTSAIGSIYSIAAVSGPLLGGVITDSYLGWRWPRQDNDNAHLTILQRLELLDPMGLMLFVPAIICLILALQFSGSSGSWSNPRVIALLTVFSVLIVAFCASQIWLGERATLPPRIAKNRTVIFASFFVMMLDGAYYTVSYFFPIFFQALQEVSASESGVRSLPQIIGAVTMSLLAGIVVSRTGHYVPWVIAATVVSSIGCGLLTVMNASSGAGEWIGFQAMVGIGVGFGMLQSAVIVQNVLDKKDHPIGIAFVTFFQAMGPTVLVSVGQSLFNNKLSSNLARDLPGVDTAALLRPGATEVVSRVSENLRGIVRNDINNAIIQVWYTAAAACALSAIGAFGMEWKALKK